MTAKKALILTFLCGALTACASKPASNYYSLVPLTAEQGSITRAPVKFAINVQPVVIPVQVDRPQIVLTDPDSTQVMLLNSSLWSGPLADEIRSTLARDLADQLGTIDMPITGASEKQPFWKVNVLVQRFESIYGKRAVLEATWRLSPVNVAKRQQLACRAVLSTTVGEGMSALVSGQQKNLLDLSSIIASQLRGGKPTADSRVNNCT
ncbi:membrane integrity-associated transporter subunit PqiC [Pusillimonas sp. ANT_WB101]|uniref:PqiC family protein n=1 Tax=Pusillimonas sp. ANT_WB101 TaxID=2597356 RepID=UPI00165E4B70|nr:PqiC family protein [Pusillimonas sp. ANT_WB101]